MKSDWDTSHLHFDERQEASGLVLNRNLRKLEFSLPEWVWLFISLASGWGYFRGGY